MRADEEGKRRKGTLNFPPACVKAAGLTFKGWKFCFHPADAASLAMSAGTRLTWALPGRRHNTDPASAADGVMNAHAPPGPSASTLSGPAHGELTLRRVSLRRAAGTSNTSFEPEDRPLLGAGRRRPLTRRCVARKHLAASSHLSSHLRWDELKCSFLGGRRCR